MTGSPGSFYFWRWFQRQGPLCLGLVAGVTLTPQVCTSKELAAIFTTKGPLIFISTKASSFFLCIIRDCLHWIQYYLKRHTGKCQAGQPSQGVKESYRLMM